MKLCALLAGFFLISCSVVAQDFDEPTRGLDGGTEYHVTGIVVRPLTGKPFSGRSTTEWTRTLEDGTVVTTHLFAMVARDSQGRIYRERRSFVPANSDQQSKLNEIIIMDPLSHTRTTCVVATRHCDVAGYYATATFKLLPPGPIGDGKRFLTRESIGNDVLDGVEVTGTRETLTVDAGVLGNNQPLTSTREFWYFPDLQINLAVTRNSPREGKQVIRVGELSRAEPDPAMFKVPAGFVVGGSAGVIAGANGSASASSVVEVSPGVVQGLNVYKQTPVYPEEARRRRIQGQVVLSVVIDRTGVTKDIHEVTSPDKTLSDAAISAVSQWCYRPYQLSGSPTDVRTTVVVVFTLHSAVKLAQ